MNYSEKIVSIILLLVFALSIFTVSFASSKNAIKIGVDLELSQAVAQYGQKELEGIRLAIDEINKKVVLEVKRLNL